MVLILLREVWPFFKEMIFRNTSLREAIATNRLITYVFLVLLLSFSLNIYFYFAILEDARLLREQRLNINNYDERRSDYETQYAAYQETLDTIHQQIDILERDKAQISRRLENAENRYTTEIGRRDTLIDDLRRRLTQKQNEIDALRNQLVQLKGHPPASENNDYLRERYRWLESQEPN